MEPVVENLREHAEVLADIAGDPEQHEAAIVGAE
jgi:hypothetical protein